MSWVAWAALGFAAGWFLHYGWQRAEYERPKRRLFAKAAFLFFVVISALSALGHGAPCSTVKGSFKIYVLACEADLG